jgi:YbgC/YbaW family acyl-CoA thioester hydrolase
MTVFKFHRALTVRVNDLNYGNHVGHQNFFSYFQEARVAYLSQFGYSELDLGGCGMILAEAGCKYKQALFLNDKVRVACAVSELKAKRFTMAYQIERDESVCAEGFTINLGFDYQTNRVVRLPEAFIGRIKAFEGL